MLTLPFDNSYVKLPDYFYARVDPQTVSHPELIQLNEALAAELSLDTKELQEQGAAIFSGQLIPVGAEPLAMAYTGHQFGHFNPQLGDGRAILLGELLSQDGVRYDVQLKGSGRTPFSRGGDGRAALGPVLREYILCEFMHRVGVPTTRALAAVTTGDQVVRDRLLPGAIVTRLSTSYVRVGTFQYFAARGNQEALRLLTDYVIQRNYPELIDHEEPWLGLLQAVCERQAALIAQWMQLGFIHGVMNTDNMSIAGETIDYGPCAFIDNYHPATVFSSIDQQGRYAYQNQPAMAHWNLCRFAETLLVMQGEDDSDERLAAVQSIIDAFPRQYQQYWLAGYRRKLGLVQEREDDKALVEDLLTLMAEQSADFTLVFRSLSYLQSTPDNQDQTFLDCFRESESAQPWLQRWRDRLSLEGGSDEQRCQHMQQLNPLYIPRNHQIEKVIRAAEDKGDFAPFYQLLTVLQQPFALQVDAESYALPPRDEEKVLRTFCGT